MINVNLWQLRTQKARGIHMLSNRAFLGFPRPFASVPNETVTDIVPHSVPWHFPIFARPCPEKPRHGFVESRLVVNVRELLELFVQARSIDPEAEIVCMEYMTGAVSAMATDAAVVYGRGNDGVTSGKGPKLAIPCNAPYFTHTVKSICTAYDTIKEDIPDSVYMELVEHKGDMVCVQIRNGPKVEIAADYWVPEDGCKITDIKTLPSPDYDLLEWERDVAGLPEGTALWLPGHSLGSHYAVHGITRGLPVFCTEKRPRLGKKYNRPDTQPKPMDEYHYVELAANIDYYSKIGLVPRPHNRYSSKESAEAISKVLVMDMPDYYSDESDNRRWTSCCQQILTSVATLHAMSHWGPEQHLIRLRAFGATTLARYLAAACAGEARYFFSNGPGQFGHKPAVPWDDVLGFEEIKKERSTVYGRALNLPLESLVPVLEGCVEDFGGLWCGRNQDRRGDGSCAYGGRKWKKASEWALKLTEALVEFKKSPDKLRWNEVVHAYNVAVNVVHNNGRLLTKWVDAGTLDKVAKAPQLGLINPWTMRVIYPELAPKAKTVRIDEELIQRSAADSEEDESRESRRRLLVEEEEREGEEIALTVVGDDK